MEQNIQPDINAKNTHSMSSLKTPASTWILTNDSRYEDLIVLMWKEVRHQDRFSRLFTTLTTIHTYLETKA
jgi:hypothetical protein